MASSTLSLDSLSSPSPSPSPSPPPLPAKITQLDPDSELSELTDDDQEASDAVDKRAPSSVKEDDDNIHPIPSTSTSKVSRRGTHQHSSRRGGAVGRKKRSSIVPAPMWGWAENKTAPTSSAAAPVEEEEEEMSGPPRAMEEEEEEEEDEEDEEPEDGDFSVNQDVEPGRGYGPQRRIGPYISQRYNGISYPPPPTRHWVQQRPRRTRNWWHEPDERPKKDDEEEASDHKPEGPDDIHNKNSVTTINGGDDDGEGSASGSPYPSTSRKKRSTKQRAPPVSSSSSAALRKRKESGGDYHYSDSERPAHPLKRKKNENNNKVQHDEDEEVSNVPAPATPAPPIPLPQAASDNENTESEEEPFVLSPIAASPPTAKPISPITTIIAMNNNTAEAMDALTALAAAADSIDITDPIPHPSLTSTPTTSSLVPGFGPGSVKSFEAPATLTTSVALTTGAMSSRSSSPAVKSDMEASSAEDEPRPTRSKAKNGRSAVKGKGGNVKDKAGDKNTGVIVNGTEASTTTTTNTMTKKGPPPPLNLKIDTQLGEPPSLHVVDTTLEDEINDRSLDDREDADMDDLEEEEEEEEEEAEEEEAEELEEEQVDEEVNEVDEEVVDPEGDEDQEQDGADNENEDMEGENGDENENENDEDPSPDGDADGDEHEESDLQPAHRAEALDVLATIELKFALLRERLYVEKMEGLAWEERMIQASAHPEMQHLQKELTKRRDKRLELASRKRSYEVANASKRRRADEGGVWSWWKFAKDELQTDMISETNRKRRRLERERRAIERPQPIRRIPLPVPLDMHNPPPLPPTLRKIIKSYPFGTRKQNKPEGHSHHHNHHLQYVKAHYVYPEISTLSAVDIANDLDFLVQNRRMGMGMGTSAASGVFEVQQQHQQHQMPQQQHYGSQQQLYNSHQQAPVPQRNGAVVGMDMGGGVDRTINNVGMGMGNGVLLPQVQSQVQQQQQQASQMGPLPSNNSMMLPHPHLHQPLPQQHPVGVGYEHQYVGDMPPFGPSGVGGRMREPQAMNLNLYQQQQHGLPPSGHPPPPSQPTTTTKSRDTSYSYSGGPGPGSGGRMHQSSHGPPLPTPGNTTHSHGYGKDPEKAQGPGGPGPSNNGLGGGGHHTYFGQGGSGVGIGGGGSAYGPTSSSSHIPGSGMNGRRSISPVHVMSNGSGGGGGKPNGVWMSGYHPGNGGGKGGGGEWGDARIMHEDEEREMLVREREREREREKERDRDREIERERTKYRDRDKDREHQEHERERQRDHQYIQQQHRQPPLSHLHGGNGAPPPQGQGVVPHHHVVPSHHHPRPPPHHHHVVHHHHGQGQTHTSTSLPPGSIGSAPIVHSPRSTRDFDGSRPPPPLHPGPGQPHSSEVIMLSSGSKPASQSQLHPRDRERESWSGKGPDEQHHNSTSSALEYRERDHMIRETDNRKMHSGRPSSGPPMLPLEERDRPIAMSFVMPPSHPMQQTSAPNNHLGSSSVTGPGTSPRGAPPSWTTPSSYDDTSRIPSSSSAPGYLNSPHGHDAHVRSPVQGQRYAPNSAGSGMSRHITTGSSSSSSGLHHMISTPPPSRARPPPSPSYSNPLSKSHRSPVASPRIRPLSPPAPSNSSSKLLSTLPTGSGYSSSPRLSGPGGTCTPTGHHSSTIPLLSTSTTSNQTDIITKNGTQQSSSPSYPINNRNTSPLMSSLHAPSSSSASGRPPASGGSGPDRDRDRHSAVVMGLSPRLGSSSHPPPPLSKLSTAQAVDGH